LSLHTRVGCGVGRFGFGSVTDKTEADQPSPFLSASLPGGPDCHRMLLGACGPSMLHTPGGTGLASFRTHCPPTASRSIACSSQATSCTCRRAGSMPRSTSATASRLRARPRGCLPAGSRLARRPSSSAKTTPRATSLSGLRACPPFPLSLLSPLLFGALALPMSVFVPALCHAVANTHCQMLGLRWPCLVIT